ncbi:hypothetical protein [Prosthecobacter sp.]|uniref:hypothetical protein n=1 Tax=Prosthecobacter sp. TaxID=1965333 RepID=UPI003784059F
MKALKIIAGIFLLLVSTACGLLLLMVLGSSDFFHTNTVVIQAVFMASLVAIAFLTPKLFRACLMLISAALALWQFGFPDWLPLILAITALLPLAFTQPKLFRRAVLIPALSFVALGVDAFAFHHRLAVQAYSTAHSLLSMDTAPAAMRSPSGKVTAYVISAGIVDPIYVISISSGHLLPLYRVIRPSTAEGTRRADLIARWEGPVFLAGDKLVSLAYDERSGKLIDMESYNSGPIRLDQQEIMKNTKSPEAFAEFLLSLPPKVQGPQ